MDAARPTASAGAVPGPVCYGKGGSQPTVTDANLLLGRLDSDHFLGGSFRLSIEAAEQAFEEFLRLHGQSGSYHSPMDLAQGIVAISNATMEKALRVISVERGYDPRDFSLICFGGGGGLHAAELAGSLGLAQVIVPPNPGAFSAIGILISDFVRDVSQSVLLRVRKREPGTENRKQEKKLFADLKRRFAELEQKAREELRKDHFPSRRIKVERRVDLRYAGQSYELSIPFTMRFIEMFHVEHERAYGYRDPARPVEIVNLRLRLLVPTPKPPRRPERPRQPAHARPAVLKQKPVWFDGRARNTRFYERDRLQPGMRFPGPAVVVEYSSTTFVPPGFVCRVDEYHDLVLTRHAP